MKIILSSCEYHESVGNFKQADINDKVLQKIAKNPEGEPIVEKVDWKNPDIKPTDISRMEKEIYPEGFHLFTDLEVPKYLDLTPRQRALMPKPLRDKAEKEINEAANEYLIEDDVDRYIVDGMNNVFYTIMAVRNRKKTIEIEDLTVVPGRRRVNLMIALERVYNLLKPYQSEGFSIIGSARKTTSWPMIKNMVKEGWLIPVEGKRIKSVQRDEQGRIIDMTTRMEDIGDEELHDFKFQLNLPSALPEYIQKYAKEGYETIKKESSGLFKLKSLLSR
jgi:hypothetical protein